MLWCQFISDIHINTCLLGVKLHNKEDRQGGIMKGVCDFLVTKVFEITCYYENTFCGCDITTPAECNGY